ncbi:MAG: hypothetical protein HYT46_02190 [Candidatus Vogelbacteria bacterium]|nr:hypothetical protein [Candidatus Vogelbacteria bacterium]
MSRIKSLAGKAINKVSISRLEYERLKHLDRRVGRWVTYLDYLQDIQQARREVKMGDVVSQDDLFRKLGL